MRTYRSDGTTTYTYVYNGSTLSQMTVNGNTLYFVNDTVTYNGVTYYYVKNLQGDIVAILDASGNAVVEYTYNAWGVLLSTTGSMASTLGLHNPLRYRGYVYDPETALYYLQSRYYDPDVGRFINADAFASTGQGLLGNNMFAYCRNNPVSRIDPSGTYDRCLADDGLEDILLNGVGGGAAGGGYAGYGYIGSGSAYNTYQLRNLTANYDAMLGGYHSNGVSSTFGNLGNYYVPGAVTVTDVDAIPVERETSTTLYRSVSDAEANDILASGEFKISPYGMDSKQFGFDLTETRQFGNRVGQDRIVIARIPTNKLNQFYRGGVDTSIFRAGTLTVYGDQLYLFNQFVRGTIAFMS